jgi:hypothetical protein
MAIWGEDFSKDMISPTGTTIPIMGGDHHIWKEGAWARHPRLIEGEGIDLDRNLGGGSIQGETDFWITDFLWGEALHR